MSMTPEYDRKRIEDEARRKREQELESLLEEIRLSVIEFGLQYFKKTGTDLSARDAFNTMLNGYANFIGDTETDPIKKKWLEIEYFKLK